MSTELQESSIQNLLNCSFVENWKERSDVENETLIQLFCEIFVVDPTKRVKMVAVKEKCKRRGSSWVQPGYWNVILNAVCESV